MIDIASGEIEDERPLRTTPAMAAKVTERLVLEAREAAK
jgi:hypothetical protein